MTACRVEIETNNYLENQAQVESLFESGYMLFKCRECGDEKYNRDMAFAFDHIEEGCCNDCAADPETAENWGL